MYCFFYTLFNRWGRKDDRDKEEKISIEEDADEVLEGPRPMLPYTSMFILAPTSTVRKAAHWVVNLKYFDTFIMLVIILSSIALLAEDPVNENSPTNKFLNYVDYCFTGVFAVEMFLKVCQ